METFLIVWLVKLVFLRNHESWATKLSTEELMFWTVVLEKTLESPLDCKVI